MLQRSTTIERVTDVNLSLSRSYSQGQKVSFLGKESVVRSNVSLGMTAVYSRNSGETRQPGADLPQLPKSSDRLDVNGHGSYGFSNNVTGNLELGFGQRRDLILKSVSRTVRVELQAQFTF